MVSKQEVLEYHERGRKGKIEVRSTKPCDSQRDLSLAYTPGVAVPCLEIEKDPEAAYRYTAKGNLVAVVSNGTAVLGLGAIGALAGKLVMEGKGILFKKFADIEGDAVGQAIGKAYEQMILGSSGIHRRCTRRMWSVEQRVCFGQFD